MIHRFLREGQLVIMNQDFVNIDTKKQIIIAGSFPPPVCGLALVNAAVRQNLIERGINPAVINLSSKKLERNLLSRLFRLQRVFKGWLKLLFHVVGSSDGKLYLSISGGFGQLYESLLVITARAFGWSIILHHHSFSYLDQPLWVTRLLVTIAGVHAEHVVLCDTMSERLKKVYTGAQNTFVLSNISFLEDQFSCLPPVKKNQLCRIGFLGNITESKGIFDFLDVVKELNLLGLGIEALFAGPFEDSKIEVEIRDRLTTLTSIHYLGPLYGEEKRRFFESIDVLLFPTKYINEAEPLTIYEALHSGVPVIARGRGCISSTIETSFGLVADYKENFVKHAVSQIQVWMNNAVQFSAASCAAQEYVIKKREAQSMRLEMLLKKMTVCSSKASN